MLNIKEINIKQYQSFYRQNLNLYTTFLQSPEWGIFQESLGYPVIRLGIFENNQIRAIAQIIKIKAKRGRFLFIPHGPIIVKYKTYNAKRLKLSIKKLTNYLINLAKTEGFDFFRIAPILENTPENQKIFQDLGFRTAPIYMHAETTWILDLNKTENELLSQMRKTTRYLIKKAQRENVTIEKRTDLKAVDDFYQIYQETAKRENFTPFSKNYIQKEFQAFNKTKNALFLFAKIPKTDLTNSTDSNRLPIQLITDSTDSTDFNRFQLISTDFNYLASALIIFNKNTAFYHQGASIHTKIPVSYLLQWEAIKEAKKRHCQYYNFWGIYDEQSKRTPKSWQGLTLFKTGFGGQIIRYLPTQDYVISPKYYFTYLYEKFLTLRRGV